MNIGCDVCGGHGIVDVETGVEWMGQKEYRQELCECVHEALHQRENKIRQLESSLKIREDELLRTYDKSMEANKECTQLMAQLSEKDAEIERLRGALEEIRYRAKLWPSPFAHEVMTMIDALFLGRRWRKARPDLSDITEEEILAARQAHTNVKCTSDRCQKPSVSPQSKP